MLRDEKILITGPAGRIAFPLAQSLVGDNEVWGIARFSDPDARAEVDAAGITTRAVDLLSCDFGDLPDDFTYVLHLAADFSEDYDRGMKVNAEATGLLLQHCHKAKAALVMSTLTVYKPNPDPWHPFAEDDPIGDQLMPWGAPYSVTKIACEGVARFCARAYGLPIVVARMGSAYGNHGGMPAMHVHAIARGEPVHVRHDPLPYSPIHDDDIADQVEALLDAASVPATIVNWCGDEAVSVQQWAPYLGELLGVEPNVVLTPAPGASVGSVGDPTKRISITGPGKVHWRDGFRRMVEHYYPQETR
jgi:nucleoside-diphosphate-sugar epimerase